MKDWVIVTGANGGMGRAIAKALARTGRPVVMACRDVERARPVWKTVVQESGNPRIELLSLDLASFRSIQTFVRELGNRPIGCLINNAGVMRKDFSLTRDGLETTIGVNYVGTWMLTRLLLPALMRNRGGRVINTVSCTYRLGCVDESFFTSQATMYRRFKTYAASKLALLLFTLELADRLQGLPIGVNAVDPGVVNTGMITMNQWFDPLADLFFRPFIQSPEQGAATAIWLATASEIATCSGKLFRACKEKNIPPRFTFPEKQHWLWEQTASLLAEQKGIILPPLPWK